MDDRERVGYEAGLRSAALAGDEAAWRAWYDSHAEDLRRYVHWRSGGCNEITDDVLQETWMTAVRKVRDFNPHSGRFSQWISGIAALTVKNHVRKQRRKTVRQPSMAEVPAQVANVVDESDRSWRTARALNDLPPRYERGLRAKYLDGMSVADIAAAWKETPKAIESLLTRAREQFRMAYERWGREDG